VPIVYRPTKIVNILTQNRSAFLRFLVKFNISNAKNGFFQILFLFLLQKADRSDMVKTVSFEFEKRG